VRPRYSFRWLLRAVDPDRDLVDDSVPLAPGVACLHNTTSRPALAAMS
jgi:hypothetical protein